MPPGMATFFRNMMSRIARRRILVNILLLVPGIAGDFLIHSSLVRNQTLYALLNKIDMTYLTVIAVLIFNSVLGAFMEVYQKSEKSRYHPVKGLVQGLQVLAFFVGGIVIVGILIDKSPKALLTGLGASAAVLMLVFKDSILGFVAGVQLSRNNMVRIGDWIQMPDGSANGTVEEITLNTVKVRNWDNTITMIPPYTLVSKPFMNWRGMTESGGRRVDKMIWLDIRSLEVLSEDSVNDLRKSIALISDYNIREEELPTNSQLYRLYIERYLRQHPVVAQNLDLIIAQRQQTEYGLPIEVYFFLTDKVWNEYEKIQSDIFDHLLTMTSEFGLKLYQLNVP